MGTGCMPHFLEFYTGTLLCSLGSYTPGVQETGKEGPKMLTVTVKIGLQAACDIVPEDLTFSILLLQRLRRLLLLAMLQ